MNHTSNSNNTTIVSSESTKKSIGITILITVNVVFLIVCLLTNIIFWLRKRKPVVTRYKRTKRTNRRVRFLIHKDIGSETKSLDLGYNSRSSSPMLTESRSSSNETLENCELSSQNLDIELNDYHRVRKHNSVPTLQAFDDRRPRVERDVRIFLPQIIKVKPLQADEKCGKENLSSNERSLPEPDLDWNKMFNFLVNIVTPRTYKLFYVELFGYGQHLLTQGKTINKTIENIELVHKGAATALYFDLFREWKNLMGSEARPEQIENALKQVGDNEALANFQLFMRNPPMIPAKMRSLLPVNEPDMSWTFPKIFDHFVTAPNQIHVMALHNVNGSNDVQNLSECQSFSKYKNSGVKGLIDQNANAANCLTFSTGSQTQIERQTNIIQNINKRKRKSVDASDSSNDSGDEGPVCKLRKKPTNLNVMSIRKRKLAKRTLSKRNLPYHCRELVCWDKIGSEFVIDIIKRLLPVDTQGLKSEEYYLFLHHTVSVIMKKAVVPERTVLAMTLNDFNDRFERKTKRGHATCTIDTSQDVIMLGYEESECLKLYVEDARKRVIRKLKETNRDYVECEYVFIGYDGIPIVNKSFEDTIVKEIQSKRKALTCSILSQESVQNHNDVIHMREENILASDVQDMKMNHLSLEKTNSNGVSNYDEPKSTEDFSLPVEKVNDDRDEEMKDDKDQELNDDKPICKGILKTSEGQDNIKICDLCLGKEQIINVSKYDKSKSTEELSLTCEKIEGENMKNKNNKGGWYSMNALPTRPSNAGLPTRSPAGQSEKTTKSNPETKLDPIELEEITVQNECLEDFILDIDNFLASN